MRTTQLKKLQVLLKIGLIIEEYSSMAEETS